MAKNSERRLRLGRSSLRRLNRARRLKRAFSPAQVGLSSLSPSQDVSLQGPPDLLNFQLRLRHSRRQIAFPIDDSCREAAAMTATEFRDKKTREIQELFEKLSSLEGSNLSPEMKNRHFRTYQRQIERLTAILDNPALERLCSLSKGF
jgi:hypothetical protein